MMHRLRERLHHEHWPWWLIYAPVLPLYLWHAVRLRRSAFFTNVDPAIDMGGFFGERKSAIYAMLPSGCYPSTLLVGTGTAPDAVIARVRQAGIGYPLIVKPDVGERGQGVACIDDEAALRAALRAQGCDLLVQALAPGEHEFGLMFDRDPLTGRTTLLSITGKRFLSVTGDGVRTVDALLSCTHRGDRQRARLRAYAGELLQRVPDPGEVIRVEPIGNHCRGTRFHDASHLRTPALEAAVHRLIAATEGIHYGRIDVRSSSEERLRKGEFTVIELNGVSSEPGHIYDPAWSIWRCWGELLRHARRIALLSRALLDEGVEPVTLHALVLRCEAHFGWRLGAIRHLASWASGKPPVKPHPEMPQSAGMRLAEATTAQTS